MYKDIVKEPKLNKNNKWVVEYRDLGQVKTQEFDKKEDAFKFFEEKSRYFKSWLEMAMAYFRDQRND